MTETIRFKYRLVNEGGNEIGLRWKRGTFDGSSLSLGGEPLQVDNVVRAQRRLNRLILWLIGPDGDVEPMVLTIHSQVTPLLKAIVIASSARWAVRRKEELTKKGLGHLYRDEVCPNCAATIDVSGHATSPQVYCPSCDAVLTLGGEGPPDEASFKQCDHCGFFARPQPFTVFYFYFLLVVYGFQSRRSYRCNSCMRVEAWKMLVGNFLFVLGLPVAITQLVRAYFGGAARSKAFTGLDNANALAKAGKPEKAAAIYNEIITRVGHCAGVHFNEALGHLGAREIPAAVGPLQDALSDCSNYGPAYELLCRCYEELNLTDDLASLRKQFNAIDAAPDEVLAVAS